jgi:hypothetical protein
MGINLSLLLYTRSLASEPSPNTATTPIAYPINTLYPTLPYHAHQTKQEQQQEQQQQYHQSFLGPISISTKTDNSYISLTEAAAAAATMAGATPLSATDYENINGVLYSAHVERFGDPETRERWWQETEDIEMGEEGQEVGEEGQEVAEEQDSISNNEYNSVNSVLRQAFLARYQRQQQH